jgi:hypothetical protein
MAVGLAASLKSQLEPVYRRMFDARVTVLDGV